MIELKTVQKGALYKYNVPHYVQEELIGNKATREDTVEKMTVTISTGKIFDADYRSRINMISAILASEFLNQTSTIWRLSNNSEVLVTLDELKEANAVALQTFGNIIGV